MFKRSRQGESVGGERENLDFCLSCFPFWCNFGRDQFFGLDVLTCIMTAFQSENLRDHRVPELNSFTLTKRLLCTDSMLIMKILAPSCLALSAWGRGEIPCSIAVSHLSENDLYTAGF